MRSFANRLQRNGRALPDLACGAVLFFALAGLFSWFGISRTP